MNTEMLRLQPVKICLEIMDCFYIKDLTI
jgi:hypothetical protein